MQLNSQIRREEVTSKLAKSRYENFIAQRQMQDQPFKMSSAQLNDMSFHSGKKQNFQFNDVIVQPKNTPQEFDPTYLSDYNH